jgi:hypothetical protein
MLVWSLLGLYSVSLDLHIETEKKNLKKKLEQNKMLFFDPNLMMSHIHKIKLINRPVIEQQIKLDLFVVLV